MKVLHETLHAAGAKPAHLRRVLQIWLAGGQPGPGCARPERPFPEAMVAALPGVAARLDALVGVVEEHPAGDGGTRLLLRLADGRTVESVLLPRDGVCVSTQVGCAVGCTFCTTGLGGLERQVTSAEILAQVVVARRRRRIRRVVFMGMGEPAHNLDAVLEAVTHLGTEGAIGHKELVFSTVGEPRVFERLAANPVQPALALSLHSTDAEKRARLLPRAPHIAPDELLASAVDYANRTNHPLQLQWTLLAGVNDGDDELERLAEWLGGHRVVVNFIPYNPGPGLDHRCTSGDRAHVMTRALHARGIVAKLRNSVAGEVEGACGQLRANRSA